MRPTDARLPHDAALLPELRPPRVLTVPLAPCSKRPSNQGCKRTSCAVRTSTPSASRPVSSKCVSLTLSIRRLCCQLTACAFASGGASNQSAHRYQDKGQCHSWGGDRGHVQSEPRDVQRGFLQGAERAAANFRLCGTPRSCLCGSEHAFCAFTFNRLPHIFPRVILPFPFLRCVVLFCFLRGLVSRTTRCEVSSRR